MFQPTAYGLKTDVSFYSFHGVVGGGRRVWGVVGMFRNEQIQGTIMDVVEFVFQMFFLFYLLTWGGEI